MSKYYYFFIMVITNVIFYMFFIIYFFPFSNYYSIIWNLIIPIFIFIKFRKPKSWVFFYWVRSSAFPNSFRFIIMPKTIAASRSLELALYVAPVVELLQYLLFPIVKVLEYVPYGRCPKKFGIESASLLTMLGRQVKTTWFFYVLISISAVLILFIRFLV